MLQYLHDARATGNQRAHRSAPGGREHGDEIMGCVTQGVHHVVSNAVIAMPITLK